MERLQKAIADAGYTSRRKAEELIKEGKVIVNGEVIDTLGYKVDSNDVIEVEGHTLNKRVIKEYYILNKPREVICSVHDEAERLCVIDLIDTSARIYPVGRLDYDTTGLIILTNDGTLANILMHPRHQIKKTYIAKINGILKEEDFKNLRKGILIDNRRVSIDNFKVKKQDKEKTTSLVEVTIHEGRNHIVRRLFENMGYDVLKLNRSKYGCLELGDLKSGEYRSLSESEVKKLYEYR